MTIRGAMRATLQRAWNYAKNPQAAAEIASATETLKALGDGITKIVG
jgi:hypothetical protein